MKGETEKVKYFLAKSWKRILARFFDFLLLSGIVIIFYVMFFYINKEEEINVYRFLGWAIVTWIINIVYFILIPFFCKGRTMFLLAFGLRYVDLKLNHYMLIDKIYLNQIKRSKKEIKDWRDNVNYFFNLFKKEVILSQLPCFILLIFAITIASLGQAEGFNFLQYTIGVVFKSKEYAETYKSSFYSAQFGTVFIGVYSLYSFIMIIVFINTIVNSESRTLIDKVSGIVTIDLRSNGKDISKNNKTFSPIRKNYDLPGEIVGEALEEIVEKN